MDDTTRTIIAWIRRPIPAIILIILLASLIFVADVVTGERLDLSILYFLPITLAAWALGRYSSYITALASGISYLQDQIHFEKIGEQSTVVTVLDVLVRLLVFGFAAEVTFRLARSMREARRSARELARLNTDLQNTYASLDDDINAAGLLQRNILEMEKPNIAGCSIGASVRYAGRTGGDFADAGKVDGKIYFCIGDISGKGTPAALFTTLLKHLLNDALEQGLNGSGIVMHLNTSLRSALPVDKFVTLFYAEIDPKTGALECVNAGHPDGLVYRAHSGQLDHLEHTAPIIGSFDLPDKLLSSHHQLQPNDVVVIYSDGVTDSKCLDGTRLGDEPIKHLMIAHSDLEAQEMADAITSDIESLTIPGQRDDIAVICVKYTGASFGR